MAELTERLESGLARRDVRRAQLLESAAIHFREHGYAAASMRDIAAAAGIKAGSMYYHFDSKEDLLVAVHEQGIRRIVTAVETAAAGEIAPWRRLQAAMTAHLSGLLDGGDFAQVVIRELPHESGPVREKLIRLRDHYEVLFRGLVDALPLPSGASRQYLRLMILGAMNWSQTWYRTDGDTPVEIAAAFIRLLKGPVHNDD